MEKRHLRKKSKRDNTSREGDGEREHQCQSQEGYRPVKGSSSDEK